MKKPGFIGWLCLLFLLKPGESAGETQTPVTELYTTEQGLSSTKITCIAQDEKGFVWIGTEDGLNKFDGYQFTVYKQAADSLSLVSDHITALYVDSRQRLWVATIEGLHYYEAASDRFVRVSLHQPDYIIKNNQCVSILEDKDSTLWFTCSGLGVLEYRPAEDRSVLHSPSHTRPAETLCSGYIRCMAQDKEGNLWFGSQDRGISVYDPVRKSFRNYDMSTSGLPDNAVFDLDLLADGRIAVSTIGGGLAVFDPATGRFTAYPRLFNNIPTRYVYCALHTRKGELLVGTDGNGLMCFDPSRPELQRHPAFREQMQDLGDTKVHCLFEDKQGFIWAGINYKGLCVIKETPSGFRNYRRVNNDPNSLSYGHVMGIATAPDNTVWIATDGGGLNCYDRTTGRYTHYRYRAGDPHSISDNAVVSVFCDSKNRIWAGTYVGGLCLLADRENGRFVRYQATEGKGGLSSNFVKHITEDKQGRLWIATNGGGLNRFDPETGQFEVYRRETHNGLISDYINRLFIDSRGVLWIATYFGLSCLDLRTETFTAFRIESGISNLSVYAVTEDKEGTIWVGTRNGLNRYDRATGRFTPVVFDTPGISLVINGLAAYKEQLWMSTNRGIVKYVPSDGTVKRYDRHDGLQSDEFILSSYHQSAEGEIFFGGVNGFNSFFPDEVRSAPGTPPVYITDLKIFNQSVPVNKAMHGRVILKQSLAECPKIRLRHSDKSFTLVFTAPDAPEPKATVYACRMEGFERDWVQYDYTQRYVTYTNLDPGRYVFRVKASNDPTVWGEASTALVIEITPPLWATWWARLGYALLACGFLYAVLRFAFIRLREKNELRIERLKVKQQEELSQAKMQFFTNISHEFRTPLTLIIGPLESMLNEEDDPEKQQTLRMMERNAERLLRLINQILELRKAEQGKMRLRVRPVELVSFVSEAMGAFTELAERKHIAFTYSWFRDEIPVWYDPDMLDKCIYNMLSNAFKFTPEQGKIQVELAEGENGSVVLCVRDSGSGMDEETLRRVFERFYQGEDAMTPAGTGVGMHLVRCIVELHHGRITVESEKGKGSTFRIVILPGHAHFSPEDRVDIPYRNEERPVGTSGLASLPEPGATPTVEAALPAPADTDKENEEVSERPTVLLVEDDEDMRRYIRNELEGSYRIVEAVNGKAGLAKALKGMPDVVVTDVMMPEMSGTELCRSLKTNPETCHIPVIILTAQGDMEHRLEGLETGADSYIAKPFHTRHLHIRIEKLIELRRSMKERFSKSLNMEAQEVTLTSTDERLLQQVIDYIRTNLESPELSVEAMSRKLGISRTHLHRKLKALTGQSPVEFIKVIRMKQAAYLLSTGKLTVSEVGYKVGYSTPSYFSSSFNAYFGMSPTAYMEKSRKEGPDAERP